MTHTRTRTYTELQTCTRKFEFDAAHRVLGHSGKCRFLHGHRYVAEITFQAALNTLGMVVDFADVKSFIGEWINRVWDHNIILNADDPIIYLWNNPEVLVSHTDKIRCGDIFAGRNPYIMRNGNPTAENMAHELFDDANAVLARNHLYVQVVHVRLYETPSCWSDYSRIGEER